MDATEGRTFGALLRAHRVAAGLSQEELAERAHLSRRTISDLERGVTTAPYRDTVALLGDALALGERERMALDDAVHRARAPAAVRQEPQHSSGEPLLETKLITPRAHDTLVARPRLLERLWAGVQGPFTLLSAPAGSGKTTLLGAWHASLEGGQPLVAWVALDEADNDPARFWRYALTALDRAAPGVGAPALAALRGTDAPAMEAVIRALLNAVTAQATDIVLVLDDYHLIEAAPIHHLLAYLLDHLPPTLHLLVATRADPPLPLARLRARGAVTELRAADLRFNAEETAAFLEAVMGLTLAPDEVAALMARTEGWIAGLQLAGLSLQGRPAQETATFIATFTGSHRYIVDFLLDEVLLRQTEQAQRFLLHTCVLHRLCAPLCATVIDGENPPATSIAASQEMLERLERHNVFLIALDDERRWYRYHYLFADAVRQRQAGHAAGHDVALLHRRAGAWFAKQGLLDEAIGHALAGHDFVGAAQFIRQAASPLLARGETQTLAAWLRALPEKTLRTTPQLALLYAWLLIDLRDQQGAERYLRDAEAALADPAALARDELTAHLLFLRDLPRPETEETAADDGRSTATIRAMIGAARAIVSALHGAASDAIAQAQAALADPKAGDLRSRSLAGIGLGLAHLSRRTIRQAAEAFHDVSMATHATDHSLLMVLGAMGEASALRLAGAFDQARATYEQAITWSTEQTHPVLLVGSLHTGLADVVRECDDVEAALEHATEGLRLAHELGAEGAPRWIEWQACNLLVLARITQAQGDLNGALGVVQEAREMLAGGAASVAAILAAFEAQLRLAQGDLDAALHWWHGVEAHAEPPRFGLTPQVFVYVDEHLEIAPIQVLLAQGRASGDTAPVQQALVLLQHLRARAERLDLAWLLAKALTLQALADQSLGETVAALVAVERALALAQPAGYVRLFVDEGVPMASLLHRMQGRGHEAAAGYAATVLAAFERHRTGLGERQEAVASQWVVASGIAPPAPPGASAARAPTIEALTEREHEVLRLMAVGHSNPAIARALYIEVNTVKTHVKNVFGKLGVHSRVQAVRRATELGFL